MFAALANTEARLPRPSPGAARRWAVAAIAFARWRSMGRAWRTDLAAGELPVAVAIGFLQSLHCAGDLLGRNLAIAIDIQRQFERMVRRRRVMPWRRTIFAALAAGRRSGGTVIAIIRGHSEWRSRSNQQ